MSGRQVHLDSEFSALIRPLCSEEYTALEDSIIKYGCLSPLVVWQENGTLLDGHHRYSICEKHGLPFKVETLSFDSRIDAKIWMVLHQFGRRNLNTFERIELAIELEPLLREKAKANLSKAGASSAPGKPSQNSAKVTSIDTRAELAKAASVSHDTVSKFKAVKAKATPEVIEKVRAGEMTINQAYTELQDQIMRTWDVRTCEPFKSLIPTDDDERTYRCIIENMKKWGFESHHPIIMWREGNCVLDGHLRLRAALECGIKEVPVLKKSFSTESEALKYQIHCQFGRLNLSPEQIRLLENEKKSILKARDGES